MVSPVMLFTASCAKKVVQTQPVSMTEAGSPEGAGHCDDRGTPTGNFTPGGCFIFEKWGLDLVSKLSAVLLDGRLDRTASLGQISWHHHRMYLNARIERQEPRLGNRGDL